MIATEEESDRGGARRIPFERFADGAAQSGYPIQIQQTEQLRGLTGDRFSLGEDALQQVLAFRGGERQTAGTRCLEGLTFAAQQGLFMRRVQDGLLPVIGTMMT